MGRRQARLGGVLAAAVAATAAAWAGRADAAVALGASGWTQVGTGTTSTSKSITADSGSNRLMVVVLAGAGTTNSTFTCGGTFGASTLTDQVNSAGAQYRKSCILTLNEAGIAGAGSGAQTLQVSFSGGGVTAMQAWVGFYTGVNQTTPVPASTNNESASNVVAYPAGLTATANGAVVIGGANRNTSTSVTLTDTAGLSVTYTQRAFNTTGVSTAVFDHLVGTSNETDTVTLTFNGNTNASSLAAIAIGPAASSNTISIGQVADPTNTVTSGQVGAIDAFTVQASSGTATVQNVTVALGSPTGLSNVFLYSNSSCTGGTQYGTTTSGPGTSVTFSGANIPANTTVTTYYVCGTAATVAATTSVTAAVSSATTSTTGYTVNASTDGAGTLTVLPVVTIGNGSAEPGNSTKTSGQVGAIDTFSVQTSGGNATITAVAVTLSFSSGTPLTNVFLNSSSACTGTTYGTLASPISGSNTIALSTNISATNSSGTTNLYVCGTAATVASNATVTGTVASVTATGYGSTDNDTGSSTLTVAPPPSITIGNGSAEPGNSTKTSGQVGAIDTFSVQTSSGNASITAVAVTLSFSAGTPLTNVFVNGTSACTGTTYGTLSSPVSGSNTITLSTNIPATTTSSGTNLYLCGTAATVGSTATVTGTVASVTASGYASTTSDTTSSTLTVAPPPTIAIGNGSAEPASSSKTSGQVGAIDAFSLQTNGGTATISAVAVTLTFSAGTPLTNVFVNSTSACTGTTYGTLASPVSGSNTITLGSSPTVNATSSSTNLYLCGTAATVTSSATVTGTVASVTASGYASTDADTTSATLTVAPPPVPGTTTGNVTATVNSCNQVTVSASYTGDTDGDNTVTFSRSTDGTTFTTLAACTNLGGGANPRVCADTTVAASTSYWYRAQFTDSTGGVSGTNPITTATSVNTGACASNLALTNPGGQPAAGTLTVGASTWALVGQLSLAASSGTVTLDSIGILNGAASPLASGSEVTLNLVNSGGTAVDSTGRWDGSKWVFASILDGTTGQPISIGTTPVTFLVYATANYGAVAGDRLAMEVNPAYVTGLAPATATTGATFTANTFTIAAPAVVAEGSLVDGGAPMVSIANPASGKIVTGSFLVQVYVYSANGSAISAKALTTDGSTPTCAADDTALVKDSHTYGSGSDAMYAKTLSLGIGTYTLKACAKNTAGTIVSEPVTITVRAAGAGDGNLLVRDNSAQLCTDCHDQTKIQPHTSEAMSASSGAASKYGTWATNCRDCHTPHSTRNLYLVKEQITPPEVNGYQPTKNVYLATTTGDSNVSGSSTPASSSFANTDQSGVCQACHTRTMNPARTYSNGTFTNGSTAVTAGASEFVTGNAPTGDVGNYVLAPDGRSYQIAAVASGTSATLASAYQGSNVSGTAKFYVGPARWRNTGNSDTHFTAANGTATCTSCHAHKGGFAAGESKGGANCSSCHAKIWATMTGSTASKHTLGAVVGTNDSYQDSGVSWSTQTQLSAISSTQRSCVNMCHDDHIHDLSPSTTHQNNVYANAGTSTTRAMTRDGSGNVTSGNPASTDFTSGTAPYGMCVSCHTTAVDANRPAISGAQFSGGAHDAVTTSDGTNSYSWGYTLHDSSTFNRNCTKCHASETEGTTPTSPAVGSGTGAVHGGPDPSLLSGGTSLQNAATAQFVCWNCHASAANPANGSQGNRSNKDVQAALGKAYGHPVATTDAKHNTVTERSATYNGGQFSGTNRHAACADCHDPHEAGKTLHANGTNAVSTTSPIYGVSGVTYTPPTTNWTATTTSNFAFQNGVAPNTITHEYELCLKCHSSFAYGTTPPTGETDQSLEFSTSNQSYHPVAGALPATDPGTNGSSQLTSTQLCTSATCTTAKGYAAGTQFWTPGQTMYCSDCHGNDTASPAVQGPHGSSVQFVLRGPNRCWPYTASAGANSACTTTLQTLGNRPTSNAFLQGNFCMNCHPMFNSTADNSATDWSGNKVHYEHSGPQLSGPECVRCHVLIPHGGKVSRLIAANGLTAAGCGNVPAAYCDSAAPPYVEAYIKTAPGSYNTSNCQTSCGGHGTITGEHW